MGAVGYLLDTHTFLWAVRGSKELSESVKEIVLDTSLQVYVSAISAYEIMNKHRIGKLHGFDDVAGNYFEVLAKLGVDDLPINKHHSHFAGNFDWSHRDPFDRILAAQAFIENLTLVTNDSAFDSLQWVNTLWMSDGLKRIWNEIAYETGWFMEREQEAIAAATRETARETARKMLGYGDSFDKTAAVTELPIKEVQELANAPALVQ